MSERCIQVVVCRKFYFILTSFYFLSFSEHHGVTTGGLGLARRQQQQQQQGFPDGTLILSPRSNETGGLGAKMVEYVLGASPNAKDLDTRMRHIVVNLNIFKLIQVLVPNLQFCKLTNLNLIFC